MRGIGSGFKKTYEGDLKKRMNSSVNMVRELRSLVFHVHGEKLSSFMTFR